MIVSEVNRGLIYAGDTPLASTLVVEQTGPLQLGVRAGSFTTTGQARIRSYVPANHDAMIAAGRGELLAEGNRVRGWIQDKTGALVDKAETYTLTSDTVITLTSDPTRPVAYRLDLLGQGTTAEVFVRRKVIDVEQYPAPPPGRKTLQTLVFEFIVPPGAVNITPIDIYAFVVRPGFPEGTDSTDWTMQTG